MTRVELKLTNLYNNLREATFCAWRHVCYLMPFIHKEHWLLFYHFQFHYIIIQHRFFLRNMGRTVNRNIEIMSLEMSIWAWIQDTEYEWLNIKQSLCLRCLLWCVFPCIPMIWCHDKVVGQRRSRATSCHYQTPDIRQATFFNFKGKLT